MHIEVYQGENERVEENVLVSDDIYVHGIPKAPAGHERIEVTFSYDVNGLIQVEAVVLSTGERIQEVIQSQEGVMSEEEKSEAIVRMEEEEGTSEAYERAKKAIHRAEKLKAACSEDDKVRLDEQIQLLQEAIDAEDVRAIERNEQKLLDLLLEVI